MEYRFATSFPLFIGGISKRIINKVFRNKFLLQLITISFQNLDGSSKFKIADRDDLRWLGFILTNSDQSYSQLFQDLWVLFRTHSKKGGFFVEAGACHPRNLNNTYLLEKKFDWKGILIEPNPAMAELLSLERESKVLPYAISNEISVNLVIADQPEFSSIETQLDQGTHRLFRASGEKITIPSFDLTHLLDISSCPPEFDYLSLDIEGGELTALQGLDFGKFRPRLISVEHNFTASRAKIRTYLKEKGYVLDSVSSRRSWDDWYVDELYWQSLISKT